MEVRGHLECPATSVPKRITSVPSRSVSQHAMWTPKRTETQINLTLNSAEEMKSAYSPHTHRHAQMTLLLKQQALATLMMKTQFWQDYRFFFQLTILSLVNWLSWVKNFVNDVEGTVVMAYLKVGLHSKHFHPHCLGSERIHRNPTGL